MACGLISLADTVITKVDVMEMLASVEAALNGKGGICGGEGDALLQVWGEVRGADEIWPLAKQCARYPLSGTGRAFSNAV